MSVEDMNGGEPSSEAEGGQQELSALEDAASKFEQRVDELLQRFEDQWTPAMENLEAAANVGGGWGGVRVWVRVLCVSVWVWGAKN